MPCFGKAGSVCLMHTRLLHGSAANGADKSRGLYICVYTAADAVPIARNPMPSPNEGRIVRGKEARFARLKRWLRKGDVTQLPAEEQRSLSELMAQSRAMKTLVEMRTELLRVHRATGATSIYVTHDQVEAMTLADRIVVMHDGIVEQIGTPLELFDRPGNLFVAQFIGSPAMNVFDGVLQKEGGQTAVSALGALWPVAGLAGGQHGQKVHYGIRPGDLTLANAGIAAQLPLVGGDPAGDAGLMATSASTACSARFRAGRSASASAASSPRAPARSTPSIEGQSGQGTTRRPWT